MGSLVVPVILILISIVVFIIVYMDYLKYKRAYEIEVMNLNKLKAAFKEEVKKNNNIINDEKSAKILPLKKKDI